MTDRVVGTENIFVEKSEEVVDSIEESSMEGASQEDPRSLEYEELAMKIILAMQQIARMNDYVHSILINPELIEGVTAAIMALPEQALPQEVKDQLIIRPNPNVQVKIVTGADIELAFLKSYYGPTEQGGNGLLPKLEKVLEVNKFPVGIDLNFLRVKFLLDQSDKVTPGILRAPIGSELITGLRNDKR